MPVSRFCKWLIDCIEIQPLSQVIVIEERRCHNEHQIQCIGVIDRLSALTTAETLPDGDDDLANLIVAHLVIGQRYSVGGLGCLDKLF